MLNKTSLCKCKISTAIRCDINKISQAKTVYICVSLSLLQPLKSATQCPSCRLKSQKVLLANDKREPAYKNTVILALGLVKAPLCKPEALALCTLKLSSQSQFFHPCRKVLEQAKREIPDISYKVS